MAKEVTLDDLVNSSNNAKPAARAEEVNKVKNEVDESKVMTTSTIKSAKPISMADLGRNLEAQHPEARKEAVAEDAPLVANAFESMNK